MISYCYDLVNWRGIKDVYFIYRGDYCDPLVAYKGKLYNEFDVSDYCFDELSEEEIKEELKDSDTIKYMIEELTPCGNFKIINSTLWNGKIIEYMEN